MDISDEMKQANERADEIAAEHEARAQKRDRKIYAFVDDRAAELDRAVTNAKAVASEEEETRRRRRNTSSKRGTGRGARPSLRPRTQAPDRRAPIVTRSTRDTGESRRRGRPSPVRSRSARSTRGAPTRRPPPGTPCG